MASKAKNNQQLNKQGSSFEVPKRGIMGNLFFYLALFLTKLLTRFRVKGQENLPDIPYVLAANHVTLVDGMWICAGLPKAHQDVFTAIAGSDLKTDYGLFGHIMIRVGRAIPIDRFGNPVRGLIMAKKAVDEGYLLLIHPEGTRSCDGKLGELHNGSAYISQKTNRPLVPVYIHGGYKIFSRHMPVPYPIDGKRFVRKRLTIEYGKPLMPENYDNVDEMTEELRNWYLARQNQGLKV